MLELAIAACFAASIECRDFSLLYDPQQMPLMTCVTRAQVEIVRWKETHPKWTVKRWRCGYVPKGRAEL